jgi:excisionase family DNA binding protein
LLTVRQCAEWFQLSEDTERSWIVAGDLPALNVGSKRAPRYRIPRQSLLDRFYSQRERADK